MSSKIAIITVAISIMTILASISGTEAEYIDAIDFTTDYNSDPVTSKWLMNYVTVVATNYDVVTTEFTVCLRIKPYSTIQQCIFQQYGMALVITSEKYGFLLINTIWIMFKFKTDLVPLDWYNLCVSYNNGYITVIVDGEALIDEQFDSFSQIETTEISFNDTFTFGLCIRDNYGPLQSLIRGMITDFNIWPKSVSKDEMVEFTTNCHFKMDVSLGPILSWSEVTIVKQGEMAKNRSEPLLQVCGMKGNQKKSLILPIKMPYKDCKKSCEKLGGSLPLPQNYEDLKEIPGRISHRNEKDANDEDRLDKECGFEIWMPIIQKGKDEGSNEYLWAVDIGNDSSLASYLPWELSQPNGQDLQQCVYLSFKTEGYTDLACDRPFCCLCEFTGKVNFHLHGMPETYDKVDIHYIFVPEAQMPDELVFTGYKQNQISWKGKQAQWLFLDRSDMNNSIGYHNITQESVLVGLSNWTIYPNDKSTSAEEIQIGLKLSKVLRHILVLH